MEENFDLTARTAEQMLDLLQRFALRHIRLVAPPEHVIRLQQQLESSRRGRGDLLSSYPILLQVFSLLAQAEAAPTMSELGAALELPLSSTTRVVDWLVRANIIERVGDPKDRRIVRVRLTKDGWEAYHTGRDYNKKHLMALLTIFTPAEQQQLLRLISKLAETIPAEKSPDLKEQHPC